MSSAAQGTDDELRRLALIIQRDRAVAAGDVYLEGHMCRVDQFGEAALLIFGSSIAVARLERCRVLYECGVTDVRVVPSTKTSLLLEVPAPVAGLRFGGLSRPDEVGRLIHCLRAVQLGLIDHRLDTAFQSVPPGSVYWLNLARYAQHHHDVWSMFKIHTVLHPPPDVAGPKGLPKTAGYEYDTEFDSVIGYHTCTELQIKDVVDTGPDTFEQVPLAAVDEDMAVYITKNCVGISGSNIEPLPLVVRFGNVLTVNEWSVLHDGESEPAVRIVSTDGSAISCNVLTGFGDEGAFKRALDEITLAWAQHVNRNYNAGDGCPVLNDADLMNIVSHFKELDHPGYGLIPRDSYTDAIRELDDDENVLEIVVEAHDLTPDGRVQFSEFLLVMRTLVAGPVEDKIDLVFRELDFQKQGWFELKEFMWSMAVLSSPFQPVIRQGYTLSDFTRWLFEAMDLDGDGAVTHAEFATATTEKEEVRNAFTALGLAPCRRLETRHPRRMGDRFVAWGHPHWRLCCAMMAGIDAALTGAVALGPIPETEDEYSEMVSYDVTTGEPWSDPLLEGNPWAAPPYWASDFQPGCRVEVVGLRNRPEYNGHRGTVVGIEHEKGALRVELDGLPVTNMLRPQNLSNVSMTVRRTYRIVTDVGEGIGMRAGSKESGAPFVLFKDEDGAAEDAGVPFGAIIEYVDGALVTSVEEVEAAVAEWQEQGRDAMLLGCIVHLDADTSNDIEPGTRVEVVGLVERPEFNGNQGTVQDEPDEEEVVNVLLDGDALASKLLVANLEPLVDAVGREVSLRIRPGGPLGFEYERRDDGPLYVASIDRDGPAAQAGLAQLAVIHEVDGRVVNSGDEFQEVLEEWRERREIELRLGIVTLGPRLGGAADYDPVQEATGGKPRVPEDGERVIITEYAPRVFAELRARAGLADDDMMYALGLSQMKGGVMTGTLRPLIEMRPGQLWYSSHDHTLILKGLSEQEAERLVDILPDYRHYMLGQKDSLLTRYFALYSLQWEESDIYFAVIANVFAVPHKELTSVYDLNPGNQRVPSSRGGWGKRKVAVAPRARARLLKQIGDDALFLAERGCIGYTFMIGVHTAMHEVEGGEMDGCEEMLHKTGAMYLGNRCWSRDKLISKLTKGKEMLTPPLPRNHFTQPPSKVNLSSRKLSSAASRAATTKATGSGSVVVPTQANSKNGWRCARCGTVNSWARTDQRVRPKSQPACAGCYASWAVATAQEEVGEQLRTARDESSEPATVESEESDHDSMSEAVRDLERREDPFAGDGPSAPVSPVLASARPGVPFDPSQERGQLRTVFQRFYGGTPGLLLDADEAADSDELTEIFHFGIVDILSTWETTSIAPPADGMTEQSFSEWYFNEYMDFMEEVVA